VTLKKASKENPTSLVAAGMTLAVVLVSPFASQLVRAQSAPDFPGKDWQLVSPESEG